MMKEEIYISTDIEADGPIPGTYSMLSMASAAFTKNKELIDTFSVNLETINEARTHPDTMKWWDKHPDAWKACRIDCLPPAIAMKNYSSWLINLPGKPVFVGYPAAYDFMFVYWYLIHFTGKCPFSHSAIDIKSFAMAVLKINYHDLSKISMPKHWFDPLPHTHVAIDDAIEQGALFCNMLAERFDKDLQE